MATREQSPPGLRAWGPPCPALPGTAAPGGGYLAACSRAGRLGVLPPGSAAAISWKGLKPVIQGCRWQLQHSCPGARLCLGRAEEDLRSGEKPQGCGDPPALGRAASTAAPHSVFTHRVWFPQFQLDLRRGWGEKKMMSISECIRWSFTAGSALGLITSTLRTHKGARWVPRCCRVGTGSLRGPTLRDHPNT